jgi:dCMP deaminase
MIINSNIKRVVFLQSYPDRDSIEFFDEAGVELVNLLSNPVP